ncbi:unnamed protein product [Allacma fusca]|uniref:Uncharacterized protein n=1 Tax=Allacma fusca TaxID=39272 RepID=A0A8J2KZ08_9HEXA|nr:unnamed protein product [Allacma fusca]
MVADDCRKNKRLINLLCNKSREEQYPLRCSSHRRQRYHLIGDNIDPIADYTLQQYYILLVAGKLALFLLINSEPTPHVGRHSGEREDK